MDRLKLDELSSSVGAVMLGVGLGALVGDATRTFVFS
jgi:hypothetical protein